MTDLAWAGQRERDALAAENGGEATARLAITMRGIEAGARRNGSGITSAIPGSVSRNRVTDALVQATFTVLYIALRL